MGAPSREPQNDCYNIVYCPSVSLTHTADHGSAAQAIRVNS
jgi:hypothetical protein